MSSPVPTSSSTAITTGHVRITAIGGPTAIIEIGGLRLLTDPTFDEPGEYQLGSRSLIKTQGAARSPEEVGRLDAILLSHDQHPDNLDHRGRALLREGPVVITTPSARDRLGGAELAPGPWGHVDIARADGGGTLRITTVPALHGPAGTEHLTGEVTGFVLHANGLPTVYVSGDNASLDVVRDIADRFPRIDVAVLFAGGARTPLLGDAFLTLSSDMAADAARILGRPHVVPVHTDGWAHFSQGAATLPAAFARYGVRDVLTLVHPGESVQLGVQPSHSGRDVGG